MGTPHSSLAVRLMKGSDQFSGKCNAPNHLNWCGEGFDPRPSVYKTGAEGGFWEKII
ncbi:hypothetical protein GbCGDNIH3_7030 [Granulibacter bethesdensis]|uniref:Uncharacterized protein n=1 Tax=Granulibacter bethesdensis TaxID=364410 RepID=A0AAN0RE42_9PROT|nr:hypothetical protein GbCGDNIH3_7030 [Granulibacter bethesdensis]